MQVALISISSTLKSAAVFPITPSKTISPSGTRSPLPTAPCYAPTTQPIMPGFGITRFYPSIIPIIVLATSGYVTHILVSTSVFVVAATCCTEQNSPTARKSPLLPTLLLLIWHPLDPTQYFLCMATIQPAEISSNQLSGLIILIFCGKTF